MTIFAFFMAFTFGGCIGAAWASSFWRVRMAEALTRQAEFLRRYSSAIDDFGRHD